MPFLLRDATIEDAAAIAEIYAPFVRSTSVTFELEPPDAHEIQLRIAQVKEQHFPYLIVEIEGVVAGYAYATSFRPRGGYRLTVEDSVYVRPGFAGKGIGRTLLSGIIERCRTAGCRQVVAVIGGNNPASLALHAGAGFTHAGTLHEVGFKLGEFWDVTLMQLAL
jgi:L-amino acid N-acyltransferase YncA